jgi:hypothetical protein
VIVSAVGVQVADAIVYLPRFAFVKVTERAELAVTVPVTLPVCAVPQFVQARPPLTVRVPLPVIVLAKVTLPAAADVTANVPVGDPPLPPDNPVTTTEPLKMSDPANFTVSELPFAHDPEVMAWVTPAASVSLAPGVTDAPTWIVSAGVNMIISAVPLHEAAVGVYGIVMPDTVIELPAGRVTGLVGVFVSEFDPSCVSKWEP